MQESVGNDDLLTLQLTAHHRTVPGEEPQATNSAVITEPVSGKRRSGLVGADREEEPNSSTSRCDLEEASEAFRLWRGWGHGLLEDHRADLQRGPQPCEPLVQ